MAREHFLSGYTDSQARRALRASWRKILPERVITVIMVLCTMMSVLTTVGIVAILLFNALPFFGEVSFIEFITGTRWTPLFASKHFGVLALVSATLMIAVLSMVVALPLGLLTAIFLSEYAPEAVRRAVKPVLEVLAGIPTVVYGYVALLFVTPILQWISDGIMIFNAMSAAIVMGIMILPMVSSLSEDAMRAVPRSLREAAYGLGATKLEVSTKVVVPAALSGIVSAFILAISRAIGETMIVTVAAGQIPNFTFNPFVAVETMTAYMVQVGLGDAPHGTLEHKTLYAVALLLFVITLVMNLLSQYVVRRFREEYE